MREVGIDIYDAKPQLMTNEALERARWVITMGHHDGLRGGCTGMPRTAAQRRGLGTAESFRQGYIRGAGYRDEVKRRVAGIVESLKASA